MLACHISKIVPRGWYGTAVHHLTSLGSKSKFYKFMDLYDTRLQVQGPLVHLTLLFNGFILSHMLNSVSLH